MTRIPNENAPPRIQYNVAALLELNNSPLSHSETIRNSLPSELRARPLPSRNIKWIPGQCNPARGEKPHRDKEDKNPGGQAMVF